MADSSLTLENRKCTTSGPDEKRRKRGLLAELLEAGRDRFPDLDFLFCYFRGLSSLRTYREPFSP